jgi:hypothetical protein
VRRGNEHVWRFHERFGATRVSETAEDYFYEIDLPSITSARMHFQKYLPLDTSCPVEGS